MLLNSHILASARCLAWKVCGLVWSTWGTSQEEDKLGARDKILNTNVARRANIPPRCKLLYVGNYLNPSFGPFSQVCCPITGFLTLLVH